MKGAVGIALVVVGMGLIYLSFTGNIATALAALTAPNLVSVNSAKG